MTQVYLMEIPVVQLVQEEGEDGELVTSKRIVAELVAPSHIVRVSQTPNGIVLWLAWDAPYIESPLTYRQFVEQLQQLGRPNDSDNEPTSEAIEDAHTVE